MKMIGNLISRGGEMALELPPIHARHSQVNNESSTMSRAADWTSEDFRQIRGLLLEAKRLDQ